MDWFAAVDIYCERTAPGFWGEPWNAVTNLSFLAASIWGAMTARARGLRAPDAWVLIALAAVIGLGSFLFHTLANQWSSLAEVLPIWSFVAVFMLVAMHRLGGMAWGRVALWAGAVVAVAVLVVVFLAGPEGAPSQGPDPLNGSGQYAPAVVAILAFALFTQAKRHPAAPWLWACLLTFLVSLTFRTLDRDICAAWPMGTHFVWHLMNGLLIGLLLQMLVRTGYRR